MASVKLLTCGILDEQRIRDFYAWIRSWRQHWGTTNRDIAEPLLLTDLPVNAVNLILDRIPIRDRFNVRNVSHDLRYAVDNRPTQYKNVKIQFTKSHCYLKLDCLDSKHHPSTSKWAFDDRIAYFKISLEKLHVIFRVPKFRLNSLNFMAKRIDPQMDTWYSDQSDIHQIIRAMKAFVVNLPHQLFVNNVTIGYWSIDMLYLLLPVLKPGILKSIKFLDLKSTTFIAKRNIMMKEIGNSDLFKQATKISIDCSRMEYSIMGPIYRSGENFRSIEEIMELMQPHQSLFVYAGCWFENYVLRLQEKSKMDVSFDFVLHREVDFKDFSNYIRIQKKSEIC